MRHSVYMILILLLLFVGCEGEVIPASSLSHTNITSSTLTYGSVDEVLVSVSAGSAINVVVYDSSRSPISGLTVTISYFGGFLYLTEAPGTANVYYCSGAFTDGSYTVSISGSVSATCTFDLVTSDAPTSPSFNSPAPYSSHSTLMSVNFTWGPTGSSCSILSFIIHPGTVNTQVAYFAAIPDDGAFSTSFNSPGDWVVAVSRCYSTSSLYFRVTVDKSSTLGLDNLEFSIY